MELDWKAFLLIFETFTKLNKIVLLNHKTLGKSLANDK